MPTTETKVSTKQNKNENYDDFTNYMRLIKNHHHDKYQEKSDGRYAVHCSKPGELGPDGDPGGDHDGDGDGDHDGDSDGDGDPTGDPGGNDDGIINALKVPPAVSKRIVLYVNCKSPIKI